MKTPHKHAELIKAWADGAEIEYLSKGNGKWLPCNGIVGWYPDYEYRIKPVDLVRYAVAEISPYASTGYFKFVGEYNGNPRNNVKLTFDGATHELKSVEVIQ